MQGGLGGREYRSDFTIEWDELRIVHVGVLSVPVRSDAVRGSDLTVGLVPYVIQPFTTIGIGREANKSMNRIKS